MGQGWQCMKVCVSVCVCACVDATCQNSQAVPGPAQTALEFPPKPQYSTSLHRTLSVLLIAV